MTFQSFHSVKTAEKTDIVGDFRSPHFKVSFHLNKGDGCCAYCGDVMDSVTRTIDHVVPQKRGGSDGAENLLPCCKSCNTQKSDKLIEEFRVWVMTNRRKVREGVPAFTLEQVRWLASQGFTVFSEKDACVFHFEKNPSIWLPLDLMPSDPRPSPMKEAAGS